jgi:peptidoglycan-N-acetylglucosamine deacetylase
LSPANPASPVNPASPAHWPDGNTGAVALTFDVDARSVMLAADPATASRASLMSHQDYGPLVGVPRLLGLLRDYGIRATFFVPGATAEHYPGVLAAIVDAGHEVGHHGYLHESLVGVDEATEREYLERGLAALDHVAGVRPSGYRAPWWEATERTRPLLAGYGFGYDSSFFDADSPYEAPDGGGQLIEMPVCWALDDWERYAFWPGVTGDGRIDRPSAVGAAWWEEISAIHAIGGLAVLTMHPFLSGRPGRAAALRDLIERCLATPDLWLTSLQDVVNWYRVGAKGKDNINGAVDTIRTGTAHFRQEGNRPGP